MEKKLCDNVYDAEYSKIYAEIRKFRLPQTNSFYEYILSSNGITQNSKILDIGCGVGDFIKFLTEKGFSKIYGIDASEDTVKIAINNSSNSNIKVARASNFSKIIQGKFDAVLMIQCFHLIEDNYANVIHEISSVLEKGDLLSFDFRNINAVEEDGTFDEEINGIKRITTRKTIGSKINVEYKYESGESVIHRISMHSIWDIHGLLKHGFEITNLFSGYSTKLPKWSEDKYVTVVARRK